MITYRLPPQRPNPALEYAIAADIDQVYQDLFQTFNKYTDHLPNPIAVNGCLQNKWPEQRNLLAMTMDSDTNRSGESPGTISRNCENAWSHSVYSAFERLSRLAVRGCGLRFQRVGG